MKTNTIVAVVCGTCGACGAPIYSDILNSFSVYPSCDCHLKAEAMENIMANMANMEVIRVL